MKNIIRLEEAFMFAMALFFLIEIEASWWAYLLLLLGPDISMVGYLAGNKAGAVLYNIFHHKALGIALFISGYLFNDVLQLSGAIIFGHASMDRMFGYGLKYFEGFKFTHLGNIGKHQD